MAKMKDNAIYEVVGERNVPSNRIIFKDERIELTGLEAREKSPYPHRRIEIYESERKEGEQF